MSYKKAFYLVVFLLFIILLSSFVLGAPQRKSNTVGSFLETGFAGIFDALGREEVNLGLILLLMFILLYGIYSAALTKTLQKEGDKEKANKTTKAASLALAGISILGMFYGLSNSQILAKGYMIASGFSMVFSVIVAVIIFMVIRGVFAYTGGEICGKDSKNVGSWLGLGLALLIIGNVSGRYDISGIGTLIVVIWTIWMIFGAAESWGGGDRVDRDIERCFAGLGDLSDKKTCEDALKKLNWDFRSYVRDIDSLKTKIEVSSSSTDFTKINTEYDKLITALDDAKEKMRKVISADRSTYSGITNDIAYDAGSKRSWMDDEIRQIREKQDGIKNYISDLKELLKDLDKAKDLLTTDIKYLFGEPSRELKRKAKECANRSMADFRRVSNEERSIRTKLAGFERELSGHQINTDKKIKDADKLYSLYSDAGSP